MMINVLKPVTLKVVSWLTSETEKDRKVKNFSHWYQRIIKILNNIFMIRIGNLMKGSSSLFHNGEFKFSVYPTDNTICSKFRIHEQSKTAESLEKQYHKPLFLGYIKPHNSTSNHTFSRQIKQILQEADRFSPHAVRGASCSYARKYVQIETVLNIGKQRLKETFAKSYRKPIEEDTYPVTKICEGDSKSSCKVQ